MVDAVRQRAPHVHGGDDAVEFHTPVLGKPIEELLELFQRFLQFFRIQLALDLHTEDLAVTAIADADQIVLLGKAASGGLGSPGKVVRVKARAEDFFHRFEGQTFGERTEFVAQAAELPRDPAQGFLRPLLGGFSLGVLLGQVGDQAFQLLIRHTRRLSWAACIVNRQATPVFPHPSWVTLPARAEYRRASGSLP